MSGPGLNMNISIGQKLAQRQVLSQQTIQSLSILQMPSAELSDLVTKELLENPTLEASDFNGPETAEEFNVGMKIETKDVDRAETSGDQTDAPEPTLTELRDFLQANTSVGESAPLSSRVSKGTGEEDAKQEVFNQIADVGEDLHDHLMAQLRERNVDELDMPLLEAIVFSLDHRGYLEYPIQDILVTLEGRYSAEEGSWALKQVQSLDPKGVGALSLADCLLLQIGCEDPDYPQLKRLLTEFWEDVLKNRVPDLARKLKVSKEEIKTLIGLMGSLDPHPGSAFSHTPTQTITPDVIIEYDEDEVLQVL